MPTPPRRARHPLASTGRPQCPLVRCSTLLAFTDWPQFLAQKVARRSFRIVRQRAKAGVPDPLVERSRLKLKRIKPGSVASALHCLGLGQHHNPPAQSLTSRALRDNEQLREQPAIRRRTPQASNDRTIRVTNLNHKGTASAWPGLRFVESNQGRRYGSPDLFIGYVR